MSKREYAGATDAPPPFRELAWRKSSYSNTVACVEVARDGGLVLLRDTKDRTGPVLQFSLAEWSAFLAGVRSGEFDVC